MFLLRLVYMWSVVNLLKDSPKISDLTKRDFSVLDLSDIHGKVAEKHRRAHFSSVLWPLTRWLQKGVLKEDISGIQGNTSFGLNNLRNIQAMNPNFFYKVLEISSRFLKSYKNCRKGCWFSRLFCYNILRENLSIKIREHVIAREPAKTQS